MNNMRLCHVFEEDYDTLEEVVVYQFGRMYELDSELAKKIYWKVVGFGVVTQIVVIQHFLTIKLCSLSSKR